MVLKDSNAQLLKFQSRVWCPKEVTKVHAVLCRKAQAAGKVAVVATSPWQRKRHWFAPAPHLLLARAVAPGPETVQKGERDQGHPASCHRLSLFLSP